MIPIVSMIVPCYNKERFIPSMLQSVLDQTYDSIQLILVNDGSTDRTRSIIADFEPKLKMRGYSVIIIDQTNQGQGMAVYNGLLMATGEYICFPDCDDILDREYVEAMVNVLESREDVMQVVCGADRCHQDECCELPNYFERLLLLDSDTSVCLRMIRYRYLQDIRFFETYPKVRAKTQEPQILLPLAKHRGAVAFLPRVLYQYVIDDNRTYKTCFEENAAFWDTYHSLSQLSVALSEREIWMSQFGTKAQIYVAAMTFFDTPVSQMNTLEAEMLSLAQKLLPNKEIAVDNIKKSGIYIFWRAVCNALLSHRISRNARHLIENKPKRIIAYGALGQFSPIIYTALCGTPFEPLECWDRSAQENSMIFHKEVVIPRLNSLEYGDVVLTLPRAFAVKKYLTELDTPAIVLSCTEVCDLLAAYYYPDLWDAR